MTVVVRSLSDQLVEAIRGRILSGAIGPGEPVRQDALAAELGVSKIPVREALRTLEQDGLLRSAANKGFFAAAMSRADAAEVFALRLKLEPDAAAAAALAANDAERRAARNALQDLNRDSATAGAANRAFHMALIRPGGQTITAGIVERLHMLADRYVRKHLEPKGRAARARREHAAILAAWLARDSGTVAKLTQRHIAATLADLDGQLREIPANPRRLRSLR
jgi:DNA-binding GntR family transcriptional regulator